MREWIAPTRCAGCGTAHRGRLCLDCLPPAIHRVRAPSEVLAGAFALTGYDAPLATAVRQAKYRPDRSLMVGLAEAFADRLVPVVADGGFDAVVPAPSPWTRRVKRGFSPAAVMAHAVSRRARIPSRSGLRLAPGRAQASLDGRARRQALSGRLRARKPVRGRILLVDDVSTTGATAEACARELLGGESHEVWLAVLCFRRPKDTSTGG